jgi:BTB/POZ domain-containing protein KCTD9
MTDRFPTAAELSDRLYKSFESIYDGADEGRKEADLLRASKELSLPLDSYRQSYELWNQERIRSMKIRKSFDNIYDGPDEYQREYDLIRASAELNMPLDSYRRLYNLRDEEQISAYPKSRNILLRAKYFLDLPSQKIFSLLKKRLSPLVQNGAILAFVATGGKYLLEAPQRTEQAHHQAWQIIDAAQGQKASGGRIEALQALNKDGIDLHGLDISSVYLAKIELHKAVLKSANLTDTKLDKAILTEANLTDAKLDKAILTEANLTDANLLRATLTDANLADAKLNSTSLRGANLNRAILVNTSINDAKLIDASLAYANLTEADLTNANLTNADLRGAQPIGANFEGANLTNANLDCWQDRCTNFQDAKNITPKQIQAAANWQQACYDEAFGKLLGLQQQNPKCGV